MDGHCAGNGVSIPVHGGDHRRVASRLQGHRTASVAGLFGPGGKPAGGGAGSGIGGGGGSGTYRTVRRGDGDAVAGADTDAATP